MTTAGIILLVLGATLTLTNAYLSFLRYPIHRARGGEPEAYRWVSGFPVFGSLFLWISIFLLPTTGLKWLAGLLSVFDTGGIHVFLGTMWWRGQLGEFFRARHGGT